MSITVYGACDDLIEVEGDIYEEFTYSGNPDGDLLAFSDGTILRIRYSQSGVWRITQVALGTSSLGIEQAPEDDDLNYSDGATLSGARWVMQGVAFARSKS